MRNKKYLALLTVVLAIALFISYTANNQQKNEPLDLEANPVVIIHGYNPLYNSQLSQITLKELADALAEDLQYSNKGVLYKDTTCEQLGSLQPIVIRASYFNDFELLEIPDYAQNLAAIINTIKKCTQARQVNVVAHSMGGIVARYYLQHIDSSSIKNLVMLGTPNHGKLYNVGRVPYFLKEEDYSKFNLDFIALTENTTFMRTLNSKVENGTNFHTIAGDIDGVGDGLIVAKSVHLNNAQNWIVGCNHWTLKVPSLCPEGYEHVLNVLQS